MQKRVHAGELTPGEAFRLQVGGSLAAATIPMVLHFVWIGEDEPEFVTWCRRTIVRQYPGWEVRVWREEPDWPEDWHRAWERCAGNHSDESDILRWWALSTVGGQYWDADFVGIRPLPASDLDHEFAASYGNRPGRHGNAFRMRRRTRAAFCGWMAARPDSQILRGIVDDMLQVTDRSFGAIGMAPLARAIRRGGVHLVDTRTLYPVGAVKGARQWSKAYHYAIAEPKPDHVCAVHLWLGGRSYAEANEAWRANHDAHALLTANVMAKPLLPALEAACLRSGLAVKSYCTKSMYRARRRETKNLATWGVKWKSERYRRGGRNVLYLENTLLYQPSGVYVDHAGFFCDSSIATEPQPDPTPTEVARLQAHVRRHLGWNWWSGGDPEGPILLACQKHNDCSVRFHYAPQRRGRSTVDSLIEDALEYLPAGVPVIVRPHPVQADALDARALPPGWILDRSPSIYQTLRACRAVVTITSTVATEALALGLPVACLGRSCWEGHGVVLECASDPSRLRDLPTWSPEEWPVLRYLCAVMRHHIDYQASPDQILATASVQTWLERATGRRLSSPADALASAAAAIREHGSEAEIALLSALEAKLADCRVCSRQRLERRILDLHATAVPEAHRA